jgi:hypothetical protein
MPPPSASDERARSDGIVIGTVEQVTGQQRSFGDAAGADLHFVAALYWPGMDPAERRGLLDRWGSEVLRILR